MTNTHELREQAKKAFGDKDFELAAGLFKQLWSVEVPDKWDGWNYARSLRRLKWIDLALDVCRAVYALDNAFAPNHTEYGWCIYQLCLKKSDDEIKQDEKSFLQAADAIMNIGSPSAYSAHEKTLFRVLKYLKPKKKQRSVAQKILEWTDKISPELLSTQAEHFERGEETEEGASPREMWYSYRSSALFELGEYQACIDVCVEAIASLDRLHYGNQHWFKMRIANSKGYLGQFSEAIEELNLLARQKSEWFIFQDLATWHSELEQWDEAFRYAVQAAQAHRNSDKLQNKWELFLLMGKILCRKDIARAGDHLLLAYKLRAEQQWNIPKDLNDLVLELQIDIDDPRTSAALYRELKNGWEEDSPRLKGVIKTVKPDKEFGFVTGSDAKEYHFKYRDFKSNRQNLREGLAVSFLVQPSFDRVKNRPSVKATDIRIDRTS